MKAIPFNKKNALAFANRIFSENKNGTVTLTKLCTGNLIDPDDAQVHCAIGEAYYTFVNTRPAAHLKKADTEDILHKIVDKAVLKNKDDDAVLYSRLAQLVETNDATLEEEYLERAKDVATRWKKTIIPLLK